MPNWAEKLKDKVAEYRRRKQGKAKGLTDSEMNQYEKRRARRQKR